MKQGHAKSELLMGNNKNDPGSGDNVSVEKRFLGKTLLSMVLILKIYACAIVCRPFSMHKKMCKILPI